MDMFDGIQNVPPARCRPLLPPLLPPLSLFSYLVPLSPSGHAAGVIAEPHTSLTDLTADDSWLVVSSDGLLENEERGGGGGPR